MKGIYSISLPLLIFGFGLTYADSDPKASKIITGTGESQIFLNDIEKITHTEDEIKIYTHDQVYDFKVEEMESLVLPSQIQEPSLYIIDRDNLEGWDEGYADSNGYFLVWRNAPYGYDIYFGNKFNPEEGIYFNVDENLDVKTIFCMEGLMNVCEGSKGNKSMVFFTEESIYSTEYPEQTKSDLSLSTRAGFSLKSVLDTLNFISSSQDVDNLLRRGDGYFSTFLTHLAADSLLVGSSLGSLGLSLGLSLLENWYENNFYNLLYQYTGLGWMFISNINDVNAPEYVIETTISDITTTGKPLFSTVHAGIAVGKDNPNVDYDNCDFKLNDHTVNSTSAGTYTSNLHAERNITYWLKPYVIVMDSGLNPVPLTRPRYLFGGPQDKFIAYGDGQSVLYNPQPSATTGDVVNVEKKSATVSCSFSEAKDFECGVWIEGDNREWTVTTSSNNGQRNVTISDLTPATPYIYAAYVFVDGNKIMGEKKGFTTENPSIEGTWNCVIKHKYVEENTSCSITLNQDGTAKYKDNDNSYDGDWYCSGKYLTITISLSSSLTSGAVYSFSGEINNLDNPTSVKGEFWIHSYTPNGGSSSLNGDFVMSK